VSEQKDDREFDRERELESARWLLEQAQAVAHVGSWVSGVGEDDHIVWSAETYRIFGVPQDEPITVPKFFSYVHPDDRERVREAAQTAIANRTAYSAQHRIVRPDGSVRVVQERASIVERGGEPRLMVGTVLDVTDRARFEARHRFLADASGRMSESLSFPHILEDVARTAVGEFADACIIVLDDEERHSAGAHARPEREPSLDRATDSIVERLTDLTANTVVHHPSPLSDATVDRGALAHALSARSFVCVALRVRRRVFGAIVFVREGGKPVLDDFDVETAVDFARRGAFAIENARLYVAAQDSLRARDEFVAIAAHELRTPLTPLRLQAHLLTTFANRRDPSRESDAAQLQMLARDISRSSERLISLVEQLLDVSQMTVGGASLQLEQLDLATVARHVVSEVADDLERTGSTVTWARPPGKVRGVWDRRSLELALRNLLTNAMKFAPGPIELSLAVQDGEVQLAVRDFGRGLSQEEQAQLFERYRRPAPLRYYGGFGLGLWIVRRVMEQLGGRVEVWSEPGAGARFTLFLPRRARAVVDADTDTMQEGQV